MCAFNTGIGVAFLTLGTWMLGLHLAEQREHPERDVYITTPRSSIDWAAPSGSGRAHSSHHADWSEDFLAWLGTHRPGRYRIEVLTGLVCALLQGTQDAG
jgi:hypothetical protein